MGPDDRDSALEELAASLRDRLLHEAAQHNGGDLHARIRELVDREAGLLPGDARELLATRIAERSFGLGPLEPLLADPSVDEVMVNGPDQVWVERDGRIEPTSARFANESELRHAIERILAPLGRRVDEAEPLCDARLPDGSRVNVVVAPLALDGSVLTIRRFRRRGFGPEDLVANGTWAQPLHDLLRNAVLARCNVLISGGTGSGKTTTLNALTEFIGAHERIVTVEDAAELRLRHPHVVRLEARPASLEGRGEVTGAQPRPQRTAHAAGPDRRRRGARRRGAGHAQRDVERPRRLAVDGARRVAGGGVAAGRDARADGGARACRTRRSATRSPVRWTSSSIRRACPTARGRSSR